MSAPRPPNHDVIVLGGIKDPTTGSYLIAVLRTSDNSVTYVDTGAPAEVNGAVWSPDGSRAYLSAKNPDSSTGAILTYVPTQGVTTTPMATGVTPQQIAISTDGSRLYLPAASTAGTSLQVVDASSLTTEFSIPFDAASGSGAPAYSPDGKVYVPPGPQGPPGGLPFFDTRGAVGVLQVGGSDSVIGALVADLPSAIRLESGQNQQTYVNGTFPNPVVVSVVDPAGHPLPDQLVRFTDDDANARFQDCVICLTYTGPDGKATSSAIVAEGSVGPAHVLALVDQVPTLTIPLTVLLPATPPSVTSLTAGDGQVAVAFTPGNDRGISPPTGFTVTGTDVTTPANGGQTATGQSSPVTVTGLTNGDTYTFTVTANTPLGDWTSAPSERIAPGIPSSITGTPPPGEVGKPYRFQFVVSGAPTPTVVLNAGTPLPDGLTFDSATATISGTPTTAGSTFLFFSATNGVGSDQDTPTLVIAPAVSLGNPEPTPTATPMATPTPIPSSAPSASVRPSSAGGSRGASSSAAFASQPLASTGMPLAQLVGAGTLVLLLGVSLVVLARRRRTD